MPAPDSQPCPPFAAVVAAAGTGRRMGGVRKPYLDLAGRPILWRAIDGLLAAGGCVQTVVVVHPDEHAAGEVAGRLRDEFGIEDVVPGGATRQASAMRGLEAVRADVGIVLTHDAARPLVRPDVVRRVALAVAEHGAAIAAVPASETVKEVGPDAVIMRTPPRAGLWYARTPQGFRLDLIVRAHREAARQGYEGTDDAELVERLGHAVRVVEDATDNIKITTAEDLAVAEAILRWREGQAGAAEWWDAPPP